MTDNDNWYERSFTFAGDRNTSDKRLTIGETPDRLHLFFTIGRETILLRKEKSDELFGIRWSLTVNPYDLQELIQAKENAR